MAGPGSIMDGMTFEGDGSNPAILRRRLIDSGAFGEVQEVCFASDMKVNHTVLR